MLQELSMVEQRYQAVREVLDGAVIKEVAIRYGVNRRTLHRWLLRYGSGGLGALADRSRKPDRCPHQVSAEVEARIVSLRRAHPGWGPRTILNRLRRELPDPPSRSAIYRCLCGTTSSNRRSVVVVARTTGAGNDPGRWSCGRWT
jgi:transposase-like protein